MWLQTPLGPITIIFNMCQVYFQLSKWASDVFWTVSGDSGVVYKIHSSSSSAPGTYRHDNFSSGVVLEIVFVSRMENVFCSNFLQNRVLIINAVIFFIYSFALHH